nr:glycosyltransferase family 39 protein [Rhodococcus sp. D2-41]
MGLSRRGWERAGLVLLLAGTAVTYLWNITVNGMGNQFYAAAAQAGSTNWEALLFGSLDTGNFITVDKPPLSQWVMGLSGQIFGFSSASMLIPQALMAVAAVALLYGAITRIAGRGAGLLAGTALALTPVAALMFRFNNPDAVMVLAMTAAAYATLRALPKASAKWIALAGVALGLAFLAKMLEGLMVLPALGLAYLIVAPTTLGKRLLHLLGAAAALTAASGWYILITLLWPAATRPYLAGSTDNNFMNLVLGYNGFARVLGRNHGGGHGAPGGTHGATGGAHGAWAGAARDQAAAHAGPGGHGFGGFGGQVSGLPRLFSGEFGFEIGWLIPAALLALVLVLVARRHAPRTDLVRGAAIVFGGWIVVDGLVLSYMSGMVHPYYCLSLAPAVAGMFAIGIHEMWTRRKAPFGRIGLAALIATTGVWGWVILGRNAQWMPALRWVIVAVALIAAAALLVPRVHRIRRAATVAIAAGIIASLAGPAAYSIATIGTAHSGGGPTVGPVSSARGGFGGGHGGFGQSTSNPELDQMLVSATTRWSAAIDRSSAAAQLELGSGTAVMAIGGFTGSDPTPTLSQFIADVKNHQVTYYVVQNGGDRGATPHGSQRPAAGHPAAQGGWGGDSHADITDWVTAHFTAQQVGSATVYNLSGYAG